MFLGHVRGCSLLLQCRDKGFLFATETVTTRGQGRDRSLAILRDFRSRQKTVELQQDFMGLCRDKVFYVMTEFDQDKKVLVATKYFVSQQGVAKTKGPCVTTQHFVS